ncbi:MAG TPA: LysM peptidoglycan-binding domain-containing protein [Clostridiales bacterium]|nr:LysM peptidoglycan-binding domain-containing protein [Clostridiales bacterium]
MIQYIVQPGDSLYTIGLRFKTTVAALMQVNHITDPNMVYPGQILKIPLPFSGAGDTSRFPDIRKGSSGPFVLLLQSQLEKLGFYKGKLDGIFTSTTEGSVVQFQLSRNLPPTGHVDVNTWRHLLDNARVTQNSPPYHSEMVMSGLLMILSADKPAYRQGDTINMVLTKINLSSQTITLNYNTSQRYDFKIAYPSGRSLWRWSDDKSFTQVLGSVSITPSQTIRYHSQFTLPEDIENGLYHILGWNSAKQINHIKLHLMVQIGSRKQ